VPAQSSGLALDPEFARLMCDSFAQFVGKDLVPDSQPAARWLYEEAPFGLLAHDAGEDPLFIYANRTAQACFEYSWDEFVGLPSRASAEAGAQEDRDRLLAKVNERNFADGYRGLRTAKSGRRFWIEDLVMWNLVDGDDNRRGQAAMFPRWQDA
jgi:MEKHLA domain-containing protein